MLEKLIYRMLYECETEQEFDDLLNELRTYIDMTEDDIAYAKGWVE